MVAYTSGTKHWTRDNGNPPTGICMRSEKYDGDDDDGEQSN